MGNVTVQPGRLRRMARRRRTLFFGLTLVTGVAATAMMWDILHANGVSDLDWIGLALFFILFAWISSSFWSAVAGFLVRLRGGDAAMLGAGPAGKALASRTALIMPIHNEDTERVAAGIDVIWSSLARLPEQAAFDLFILSDTRDPHIAAAEERAWAQLAARHDAGGRLFYRRRAENTGRKAGNVADFVRSWGGAYEYMIVLDADSIMSGAALVELARMMDAHPRVGIIQALPLPVGRDTLFARLIQFATRLSSPMLASGLAYWQLGESNYWGHNAIIRLKAFAAHCDLPPLPGSPPLGGEILSHDFVEAAFMRRAGFEVWLLPSDHGSWEEVPSNVIDYAARDRRWAQGNLQHLSLLPARGLYWLSRVHLVTGVLSYAASPLWLLVLLLSSGVIILQALHGHQYFLPGSHALFPIWPHYRDGEIVALLSLTGVVLLLPKLLALVLAIRDRTLREGFGGASRLTASLLLEQLYSVLLAPAMMLFHSTFVISILAGRPVAWRAQERGDRGIGWLEALRRHKWHVVIGATWGALILELAPRFTGWLVPVLAGMVVSVPLTVLTSRAPIGRWMRRRGLFLTPEETHPPAELAALQERLREGTYTLPAGRSRPSQGADARRPEPDRVPTRAPLPMKAEPLRYVSLRRTAGRDDPQAQTEWRGS